MNFSLKKKKWEEIRESQTWLWQVSGLLVLLLNPGIDKFFNPNYIQLENIFLQVTESFKHSNCKAFTICDSDSQQYQIFN